MSVLSIKNFPGELKRRAKALAAEREIDLQDWVAEAFEEKLARDEAEEVRRRSG